MVCREIKEYRLSESGVSDQDSPVGRILKSKYCQNGYEKQQMIKKDALYVLDMEKLYGLIIVEMGNRQFARG